MTTFLELKNRYLVTCTLMSEANLHIGSGTEGAAADSGFVTRDGKPFIPGSSLPVHRAGGRASRECVHGGQQ
jgi:CRISPR/Cas system CSM-associated protein Csm3 (group 7 of RAMP superfamily)